MASANINFEKIPASTRKPGVYAEWNTKLAVRNLPTNKQRVLIVAQHNNPALGELTELENVFSAADAAAKYGAGSMAHLMVTAAIKAYAYADLSLITVADNKAGVAAAGKITLSGTANTQGVLRVSIANADTLTIGIGAEDTAATVAAAVKAAIDAVPDLPVTATVAEAVVTLTAKNKGTAGNAIRIKTGNTAEGITAAVTAMTGGDANPDIAAALNAVVAEGHHIIACGINDETNLLKLRAHLDTVASPMEKRWAIGVYGQTGTLAQATTLAGRLNHGHIVSAWYRGTPSLPCELAAAFAAVMASEEDPARPLNTLEIKGLNITPDAQWPLFNECNNALYNGLTPLTVVAGKVQIMRAVSTYTKSAANVDDPALLDITTIRTLDYTRRAIKERIALRFPRDKLSDRLLPKVKSEILDVLLKLEQAEIIENAEANKGKLVVSRSLQDANRVNAVIPADVVNGLHVFAGRIDLIL